MKKIVNYFLLILLTILLIPNVYALNNVKIESITLDTKSNDFLEMYPPKYEGMDISFDLSYMNVEDQVKYKVILKNYSNREYYINKDSISSSDEYIEYKYEFDNNSYTIKPNQEKTMYITIKYKNQIPQSKLADGVYTGKPQSKVSLSDVLITNPSTYANILALLLIFITLIVITIIKVSKKKKIGINLLIIGLLLIPITTYALENITITTTSKITIETKRNIIESRYVNNDMSTERDIWQYPEAFQIISFENKIVEPSNYEEKIDVSEAKDNSIIAYIVPIDNSSNYELKIMSNGYIYANKDSSYMFREFFTVTEIKNLKNLKTNYVEDMSYMFSLLPELIELDISSFNTSKVKTMKSMFDSQHYMGAHSIEHLNITGIDTSNVTDMSNMFRSFKGEELDVSSLDTSNVTTTEGMFNTNMLKQLNINSLNTSKVTNMNYMFEGFQGEELDVSNLDTSNVTDMSYMFSYTKIKNLDLSNFDTRKVTNMEGMFSSSMDMETININSFNTSNVINMMSMFSNCESLKIIDLNNFNTKKVTNMEKMFWGNGSLESVDLSSFDTSNVTNFQDMFYHSDIIQEIDLSTFDTRSVTNASHMFSFCPKLETIYVSNKWDLSHLSPAQIMFYNTTKLPNYDPNDETSAKANTSSTGYLTLKS